MTEKYEIKYIVLYTRYILPILNFIIILQSEHSFLIRECFTNSRDDDICIGTKNESHSWFIIMYFSLTKLRLGEDKMVGTYKKKTLNLILVFVLIFSLFTPFSANVSKAAEVKSVAEAIVNNSGTATVEGYIVGVVKGGSGANISYTHTGPFTTATNMAIADSANETDRSKILTVQLPNNDIRKALNLVDHPENLGKKVQITGSLEAYFAVPGLKNLTQFTFVENTNPTKVQAVSATPTEGSVSEGTKVELTTSTEGATIYYTLDGSEPTASSEVTVHQLTLQ